MALGRMNVQITFLEVENDKDQDGFAIKNTRPLLTVRAYKEDKNTTEKWSNRAVFKDISALFRIRRNPNLTVTTDMKIECSGKRYNIVSVENIRNRNMYIEILAREEELHNG